MRSQCIGLLVLLLIAHGAHATVYERIPRYGVADFISEYLWSKGVVDCFQRTVDNDKLSLKCWWQGELLTVTVSVHPQHPHSIII